LAASPPVEMPPPPSMRFFITLRGRYSLSWRVRMYFNSSTSWAEKSRYPPRVRVRLIKRRRSRYLTLLTESVGNSLRSRATTSPIV
jgi:hypothetical protein